MKAKDLTAHLEKLIAKEQGLSTFVQCYVFDYALRRAWFPSSRFPCSAHLRLTKIRKANEAA